VSARRRLTGLVTVLATLLAASSAYALPDVPDAGSSTTNGQINAIAQQGDTTYIGGSFTYVGKRVGTGIALAKSDASLQSFPEFAGGSVEAAESDGSGGWYVGGSFTHVGGLAKANLVHVLADGTLDAGFPSADNTVFSLARDAANGRLYIGGDFTHVGGSARNLVARILTATNAVDTWNPDISGSTVRAIELHSDQATQPWAWIGGIFDHVGGPSGTVRTNFAEVHTDTNAASGAYATFAPNSYVNDIEFDGADEIYVAGSFSTVFGATTRHGLAALSFSGVSLEPWNPDLQFGAGSGIGQSLVVAPGVVYVAGFFDKVGADTRHGLAATGDVAAGAAATAWNPNPSGNLTHSGPEPHALALDGSTVYVGGAFTNIGGQARNGLAALNASSGNATAWDPNVSDESHVIAVAGSTVLAGGIFTAAKGVRRESLAALDTSGAPTSWNPGTDFNKEVFALAAGASGPIYIGGSFNEIGGQSRANIAAVDGAGNVTGWNPGSDNDVYAFALSPDGQTIYTGGNFSTIGGATRENLAALNTANGAAGAWHPWPGSAVRALLLRPDGTRIFAGGEFTDFGGGATTRNYLAELPVSSDTPTAWNPAPDSTVRALALSHDGSTLFLGGNFSNVGPTGRNYLAAVDAGSGSLTSFNPGGGDGDVFALALSEDGKTLFAGGSFSESVPVGGATRPKLAEIDIATGTATGWNPVPDDHVYALLAVGPDLFVGGEFHSVGARANTGFARFLAPRPEPVVQIGQPQPEGPGVTPSAPPPDKTAPLLSALSLTNKLFAVGPKPTALTAAKRKVKKGTTFRWTLSEAATVRIQIQQERRGIKKGKRCLVAKPGAKVPRKKHCTALQSKGTLRRSGKQGRGSVAFSGRMGKKALKPGIYRAVFTATDAAGNRSAAKRLKFKIVRAR
jgi:WD40 repeat protein